MIRSVTAITAGLLVSAAAHAWEFRVRYVERIGNFDSPLAGDVIDASNGEPRRIRIQFGVFDNDQDRAPFGGFVGWNVGTIMVSGPPENSAERRTPGRMAPFNFASSPFANGNPPVPAGGDVDFQMLTDIDATLGTQSPFWGCNPDGSPTPMPPALVRGLNSYVSVYEITIDPSPGGSNYFITFGGNVIAAVEWRAVGNPQPPDCGNPVFPEDDTPGTVVYAPFPAPPRSFESVLSVVVPAPAGPSVVVCGLLLALRRRRCDGAGAERGGVA
jgi:hypothetical protein